jgi:hypothetical protein
MKKIRKLDISYTRVTEIGIKMIKYLKTLKFIGLWSGKEYI